MSLRILKTADDVTPDVLIEAEQTVDWFDGKIEWDEFWDRLCDGQDFDIEELGTPATRKIQKHVRDFMRAT